jgi:hypothetical protein
MIQFGNHYQRPGFKLENGRWCTPPSSPPSPGIPTKVAGSKILIKMGDPHIIEKMG